MATFRELQDEPIDPEASVEWTQVDAAHVLIAAPHAAWIYMPPPLGAADPWAQPMTGPGQTGTTSRLLSGCFFAAAKPGLAAWLAPFAAGGGSEPC